jgi:geranylgeranyl pyrophosphate synthase
MQNIYPASPIFSDSSVFDILQSYKKCRSLMQTELAGELSKSRLTPEIMECVRHAFDVENRISPMAIPFECMTAGKPRHSSRQIVRLSLAIHLMHLAAHTIDDVVDGDQSRDGSPAVHHQFGKSSALLSATGMMYLSVDLFNKSLAELNLISTERAAIGRIFFIYTQRVINGTAKEVNNRGKEIDFTEWKTLADDAVGSMITGIWKIVAAVSSVKWVPKFDFACSQLGIILRVFDDYFDFTGKGTDKKLGAPNIFLGGVCYSSTAAMGYIESISADALYRLKETESSYVRMGLELSIKACLEASQTILI